MLAKAKEMICVSFRSLVKTLGNLEDQRKFRDDSRGPLHVETRKDLYFRSAQVHFGVLSRLLEYLHENMRNETRTGLGSSVAIS